MVIVFGRKLSARQVRLLGRIVKTRWKTVLFGNWISTVCSPGARSSLIFALRARLRGGSDDEREGAGDDEQVRAGVIGERVVHGS
jgi:hypothetical protein